MSFFEQYNLIDVLIIGTLLVTVILGAWKGLLRSLTALAGLALGIILAVKYYVVVEPYINKISTLERNVSMILSMIIVFIGVQAVFVVIRHILEAILKVTRLSWLDRMFGALMGFAGGFLIVAASVQILLIGLPDWSLVKTSKLVNPVDRITDKTSQYAPPQVRDQATALFAKLKGLSESSPITDYKPAAPFNKPEAPPRFSR